MYLVTYGGEFLHDPLSDDRRVSGGTLSGDANGAPTLSLTVPPSNPLRGKVAKRDLANPIEARFDGQLLFRGFAEETRELMDGSVEVDCKGDLSLLSDTVVRPYTTDPAGEGYIGGAGYAALFRWLVGRHNALSGASGGPDESFSIRYPQGSGTSLEAECAKLDERGGGQASSTSKPTTLDEITDKILDPIGAHLDLWHDGEERCLALYADLPESLVNGQAIELGANMTDLTVEDSSLDVRTAVVPEGGTDADGNAITLSSLPDGPVSGGFYKSGDAVYSAEAVALYGYREEAWSASDAADANALLAAAIVRLQDSMAPAQSVKVGAMDLVFNGGSPRHLLPGQQVSVISTAHGLDLDLVVASCDIDFDSPGDTTYELGTASTRITKTYGSIIKDVSGAQSGSSDADRKAQAAQAQAAQARAAAEAATAVEVDVQGPSSEEGSMGDSGEEGAGPPTASDDAGAGGGAEVFEPAPGVRVVSARMARTGSVCQVALELEIEDTVQAGGALGRLAHHPAVETTMQGIDATAGTDGAVTARSAIEAGEVAASAAYVKGD